VGLIVDDRFSQLRDLVSGDESTQGEAVLDERGNPTPKKRFSVTLAPHSFRVFQAM
jgi:hypothetical protein